MYYNTINILDTGENYILAQKNLLNTSAYDDGIKLYSFIDINIYEIVTEITIKNQDEIDFIFKNLGKIFSYDINENEDIIQKLKKDIQNTLDFYNTVFFWKNLQINIDTKNLKNNIKNEIVPNFNYFKDLIPSDFKDIKPIKHIYDIDNKLTVKPIKHIYDIDNKFTWILYNELYNIAVVFDSDQINNPNYLINTFPEFKIVAQYNNNNDLKQNLIKFFNKISFSNFEQVKKKNESFKDLYNLSNDSSKDSEEKIRVKNFIDWHYTISSEQDKKMKANDLYKEIINHMCISCDDASLFKKRLSGYLIEFKLQKKRFSDAYYYYGITPKEKNLLSLEEIEKKRLDDKNIFLSNIMNKIIVDNYENV